MTATLECSNFGHLLGALYGDPGELVLRRNSTSQTQQDDRGCDDASGAEGFSEVENPQLAAELVQRFRNDHNDQDAAQQLVELLYPTVAKVLQHRLRDRVVFDDVAQQVFVRFFEKLHQFKGDRPLQHWVSVIAVRTCLNAMRSERRRNEVHCADLSPEEAEGLRETMAPGSGISAIAARELLRTLLDALEPADRLAIELVEVEGRTSQEAAELLGSNAVAVRVRVSRARRKMRKHLKSLETTLGGGQP